MAGITSSIDWSAGSYEAVVRAHRWTIPERLNIADLTCRRHADGSGRLALIEIGEGPERRYSFDEIDVQSAGLAGGFAALGVGPGDRVGVFLPQRAENPIAHLAALRLGAISVPLSPQFRGEALRHRLADSGARLVVTDGEGGGHLAAVRDQLPALATVVACEPAAESVGFAQLIADSPAWPVLDTAADDPAMILYTSGTTGAARGAVHAHRFLPGRLSSFELTHRLETRPSRDRPFFTPADWSWVAGLVDSVFTPWVFGCPVLAWRHRGFAPRAMMEVVARARVRSMFLPPTALNLLRQAARPGDRWPRLDSVHSAGEPLAPATFAWAASTFGRVFDLYGMTEIGAIVGSSPLVPVRPGAMGKPYPGHSVTLVDEAGGSIAGPGEGEIAVARRDPGMFLHYFGDPVATAARFRGDLMVTGDLARRDADGYLWHLGRHDDVFNTSGYRIGPTEVESVLCRHPAVARAAVVGAPDAERGQVVKAFVLLASGFTPSHELAAQLCAYVKAELAAYAAPRRVVFVHRLPMTVSGKVRRIRLRDPDADVRFGVT